MLGEVGKICRCSVATKMRIGVAHSALALAPIMVEMRRVHKAVAASMCGDALRFSPVCVNLCNIKFTANLNVSTHPR